MGRNEIPGSLTKLIANMIGVDYLIGALVMFACFIVMQKTLTAMIGYKYSDVYKNLKKQLAKK